VNVPAIVSKLHLRDLHVPATESKSSAGARRPAKAGKTKAAGRRVRAVAPKAPTSGSASDGSLVKQALSSLRRRILKLGESDVFLGSEEQLIGELGVSRPTFRQAARLLEHEQLLSIKRGIGGGFFTRLPSASGVSRMAAIYLHSQATTVQQVSGALAPLMIEAAGLLAARDAKSRAALGAFMREHESFEDADPKNQARVVLEFDTLLGQLCGNPALALVLNVMRDLQRDPRHGTFGMTPERAQIYAAFHRRLVAAIDRGDSARARRIVADHHQKMAGWLPNSRRVQA
jgi:DNA-binding FadR family transcriptional regulator